MLLCIGHSGISLYAKTHECILKVEIKSTVSDFMKFLYNLSFAKLYDVEN